MQESFIIYLWQFQYFNKRELHTTDGQPVTIINKGLHNPYSGPDFTNARIRIGEVEWAGNIEMHVFSSSWMDHQHHFNKAYDTVVLHVVWRNDRSVARLDGTVIPVLELHDRVDPALVHEFRQLLNSPEQIPCSAMLSQVQEITKIAMIERTLMERLERKVSDIMQTFQSVQHDWEETCYRWLARNFGFKVNGPTFDALAARTPFRFLLRSAGSLLQVEALLFGQAGFLEEPLHDDYHRSLHQEYTVLARKFSLQEDRLHRSHWHFLRLRPANFPTLRIAQFASILHKQRHLFASLMEAPNIDDIAHLFHADPSVYWHRHYRFAEPTTERPGCMGRASIQNIIINTVVPLLVAYGKYIDDETRIQRALRFLRELPPEENSVTEQWATCGIATPNAFDSQGLHGMLDHYCLRRRCLSCLIGASLVRPVTV